MKKIVHNLKTRLKFFGEFLKIYFDFLSFEVEFTNFPV